VFIVLHYCRAQKKPREILTELLAFGVFFVMTAILPLIHYLPQNNRVPMVIPSRFWQPLVDRGVFFPKVTVWWDALGAFAVITLIVAWFGMDWKMFRLYGPSIVVFVLANRFQFQGYSRMNVLAFYPYWVSVGSIVFFSFFKKVGERLKSEELKGAVIGITIALMVGSVGSGILGFRKLRTAKAMIWSPNVESLAQWIAGNTPKKAVFISSGNEFDVVAQLAGKVLYVQSERIAWLAGFDVDGRAGEIAKFIELGGPEEMCRKVTYVVNRITDISRWPNWTKVYSSGRETVFKRE
jgi:hypothetical protein